MELGPRPIYYIKERKELDGVWTVATGLERNASIIRVNKTEYEFVPPYDGATWFPFLETVVAYAYDAQLIIDASNIQAVMKHIRQFRLEQIRQAEALEMLKSPHRRVQHPIDPANWATTFTPLNLEQAFLARAANNK